MTVLEGVIPARLRAIHSWLQLPAGASPGNGWVLVAGCALWILAHPYWGIWHDARVYTLMALHWLNPQAFARDPWFMFGSQDQYSLFSPLYAGLISLLGVEEAARWGTLLQGLLFVWCSWKLANALPLRRGNQLVFLLLVSMQWVYCVNDYHPLHSFRLSEAFITSRNMAIGLAMLAVAYGLAGRMVTGLLWSLAALTLHPLMAFWAMLLLMVRQLTLPLRWLWLSCTLGIYLVFGLSYCDPPPFHRMNQDWMNLVHANSAVVFPDFMTDRLAAYLLGYAVLFAASRFGHKALRSWYQQVLALTFSATLLFWVCSLYAPSALIMQLQLWRANWLAVVFVVIALVDLALRN